MLSNFDIYIDHKDLSSIEIGTGSNLAYYALLLHESKNIFLDLILTIVTVKVVLIQMNGQFS